MSDARNEYAFPQPMALDGGGQVRPASDYGFGGMTLRDYFAGQAIGGLLQYWGNSDTQALARRAYEIADAMLAKRERVEEQ